VNVQNGYVIILLPIYQVNNPNILCTSYKCILFFDFYLSPIVDCFDSLLVSWTVSISPDSELVNTMLDLAIGTLSDGENPIIHSDRGGHYGDRAGWNGSKSQG